MRRLLKRVWHWWSVPKERTLQQYTWAVVISYCCAFWIVMSALGVLITLYQPQDHIVLVPYTEQDETGKYLWRDEP